LRLLGFDVIGPAFLVQPRCRVFGIAAENLPIGSVSLCPGEDVGWRCAGLDRGGISGDGGFAPLLRPASVRVGLPEGIEAFGVAGQLGALGLAMG
jgi:hypothetical protein